MRKTVESEERKMTNQEREKELKERFYFLKQKIIGVVIIVGTILVCNSGLLYNEEIQGNDWTISLLFIPMGLMLLFSKDKCWADDYFFECEAEELLDDEYDDCYEYDDEYEDEYDDYEEIDMSDILIAAFQELGKIIHKAKYFISRYKISRPIR